MIRAFSPENGLLRISKQNTEGEQKAGVVIDPFLAESFGKNRWNPWLAKIEAIEDMREMVRKIHAWFQDTRQIIGGRVVVAPDGTVGVFQEIKKTGRNAHKMIPINRARVQVHRDIYGAINRHNYAKDKLNNDQRTIEEISGDVAELIQLCMMKREWIDTDVPTIHDLVGNISEWIEGEATFFYLEKMMIDYLLKLNGGQYDSTRVYWAAQTLQAWLRDRLWKNAGITEQQILLEQAKDIELHHWKNVVCGTTTWKIDIEHVIEDIPWDYTAFKERISRYNPLKNTTVFNPFSWFYKEWGNFLGRKDSTPYEAQLKITKQYILITLQEIKMRYAYNDDIPENESASLRKRIERINVLRQRFFPEKPEISIDFSAEKNTINDALKKEIARYK